jgi:UDP-N-acetylmuramoyl-tripeptide--D-alanyl-D-alanine ligase
LRGDNFDGNAFAPTALEQGAQFAVIDDPSLDSEYCLLVEDVLAALQKLACMHRKSLNIPVIGITGSNGKTTTKELIHAVMGSHFQAHATAGNLNNHIGVPLTMLSMPFDTEIAIIEMGANHPGEIAFLSNIAQPTHGIITNIGKAHLEGFGGYEGVIRTKSELYQYLRMHDGTAFVNGINSLLAELSMGITRIFYGTEHDFQIQGEILSSDPLLDILWHHSDREIKVKTQLVGNYNFENVMAAICIGDHFRVPAEKIVSAIMNYVPANSRSQTLNTSHNKIILDAYNANPSSMLAALQNFSRIKAARKMVILGDMLELGAESLAEHSSIVSLVDSLTFDTAIFVGPEFRKAVGEHHLAFTDTSSAMEWLQNNLVQGYTILLKGSRGIRMETLLEAL